MNESSCQTRGRPFVIARSADSSRAVCFVPDCGMWTCEHCAEMRAQEWRMNAWKGSSDLMLSGNELQFVTLTTRGGAGRTRERSIATIAASWPRVVDRVKYARGTKPEFLVIPEQHKNGVVHLHVIITSDFSEHSWHNMAYKSGFGYQAKPLKMDDAIQAPAYISKYLGKQFATVKWPAGFRRVRASQGWPKIEKPQGEKSARYDAFLSPAATWAQIYMLRDDGYEVEIRESARAGLHAT